MIIHVKLEFDLDTATRQTTNITPQIIQAGQTHTCRYPTCGKHIPLKMIYCGRACFNAHGTRTKKIMPATDNHATIDIPSNTVKPIEAIPDYRSFTFP